MAQICHNLDRHHGGKRTYGSPMRCFSCHNQETLTVYTSLSADDRERPQVAEVPQSYQPVPTFHERCACFSTNGCTDSPVFGAICILRLNRVSGRVTGEMPVTCKTWLIDTILKVLCHVHKEIESANARPTH